IAQAKIRRHVDDLQAVRKLGDLGMGGAVRQPAKDDVDIVPVHLVRGDELGQIEAGEMWENLSEALPGMSLGDYRCDLDPGMQRGEPDHIGAGVAGGAEHRGSDWLCCSHDESLEDASPERGLA